MKKLLSIAFASVLAFALLFSGCSNEPAETKPEPKTVQTPSEPGTPDGKMDVSIVESKESKIATFGNYPKTHVKDTDVIDGLNALSDADADATTGYYTYKDKQYGRFATETVNPLTGEKTVTYDWFLVEPITWLVLDSADGKLLLISENVLDAKQYNEKSEEITWGVSSIRNWLNGLGDFATKTSFYNSAFSSEEQKLIVTQDITSAANPQYGTAGGENTKDRVSFFGIADLEKADSWSESIFKEVANRACRGTDYAHYCGSGEYSTYLLKSSSWWWLRDSGVTSDSAANVDEFGKTVSAGYKVSYNGIGVRPVIVLNAEYINQVS